MKPTATVWRLVAIMALGANLFTGCAATPRPTTSNKTTPLSIQVSYVYRAGGVGPLMPIPIGEPLNSGDHYKIYFKANQDCFAYVYQIDAAGQVFRLFPLKRFAGFELGHDNPVKTDTDYVLPADDLFFYLDNILGKERIYVVASHHRNSGLERLEEALAGAIRSDDERQMRQARQGIIGYLNKGALDPVTQTKNVPASWMPGGAGYPVTAYLIESVNDESVHVMEFIHR